MKIKLMRTFTALLAVMLCMAAFSVTALAYTNESSAGTDPETTETVAPAQTSKATEAITPDGNLTLVDDINGEQSEDKQFITVKTKDGNYFYLIIDRASDEDNVYFLNLVDEEDLLALIDDEDFVSDYKANKEASGQMEPEATTVVEQDTENTAGSTEKTTEGSNSGPLVAVALVIILAIGAAAWYLKFKKPKTSVKGKTDINEYDFGEDEDEEYENEDTQKSEVSSEETEREDE